MRLGLPVHGRMWRVMAYATDLPKTGKHGIYQLAVGGVRYAEVLLANLGGWHGLLTTLTILTNQANVGTVWHFGFAIIRQFAAKCLTTQL